MLSNKDNFSFTAAGYESSIDATLNELTDQKII